MSEKVISIEVEATGPEYLHWRGELLARLALARIPGLAVAKVENEEGPVWDFLAATETGLCFFILVKSFSSFQRNLTEVATVGELRWPLDTQHLRRARASQSPVILFLFDADTDHGRFLRLDTLPLLSAKERTQSIRLPIENTINRKSLEQLIVDLLHPAKD